MKTAVKLPLILGPVLLCCQWAAGTDGRPSADASWCNRFEVDNDLEQNWRPEAHRLFVPRTRFTIGKSSGSVNGKALIVSADKSSGAMLAAPSPVDLKKTPVMRWRWRLIRPMQLEPGQAEADEQAIVVYFGGGTLLKQKCVGYRWEFNTPVGKSGRTDYAAGMMQVWHTCVANRETPVGEWRIEEHDVVADYVRAYGCEPTEYFVIGVGANSQYSGSRTRAEIDFIEFVPRSEKGKNKK